VAPRSLVTRTGTQSRGATVAVGETTIHARHPLADSATPSYDALVGQPADFGEGSGEERREPP